MAYYFFSKKCLYLTFSALEKLLRDFAGRYATGDKVSMADLFLAPQLYAAFTRFKLDMTQFPLLSRLNDAYNELPAFQAAKPENQPDAVCLDQTPRPQGCRIKCHPVEISHLFPFDYCFGVLDSVSFPISLRIKMVSHLIVTKVLYFFNLWFPEEEDIYEQEPDLSGVPRV
ncbi:hypothetical protein HHK36_007878 [Tetracentron sinense]|uniref:GST C-terminal domain-containing protein n=1 Tax=Tetracentron sinense TaxID=13715 RepID=A0A834ZLD7_TETSI|nr:hypothetical protein HHK36_007878 [Tetracentron sinense]